MNFSAEANSILDELKELRHKIHEDPELGNNEFQTALLAENYLNGLGIKTERLTDTAVAGLLDTGRPGKTIAFRADMDALPVDENTGCAFSSKNPHIMHACGHDVHTAALCGAAKLLSLHKSELTGKIKFLFEPDEEGDGGARRMIDAGAMNGVSAVYGAHVDPALPLGTVGVRFGKFYAASYMFNVTVKGKSSHGASPEKGIDSLYSAAKMVCALKELPLSFPEGEALLSVGTFNSGTARNIISDKTEFKGIIRTLGKETQSGMLSAFGETIEKISSEFGAVSQVDLISTHNGVVNTERETLLAKAAFEEAEGIDVCEIKKPLMTSEDFGFFIDAAAGSFYHIGAGSSFPLHSDEFLPADEAIAIAAAAHCAVAFKELSDL